LRGKAGGGGDEWQGGRRKATKKEVRECAKKVSAERKQKSGGKIKMV
jgi:hypothetical protein